MSKDHTNRPKKFLQTFPGWTMTRVQPMHRHTHICRPISTWRCIISAKFRRYISAIFAHKIRYAVVVHGVFGNPSCYFVSEPDWLTQILCPVPYGTEPSDYIK